jgi:hypothetical protein
MSRILPHQYVLYNLAHKRGEPKSHLHCPREIVYEELKRHTGQDFGYDIKAWRQWLKEDKTRYDMFGIAGAAASRRWYEEKQSQREQLRQDCQKLLSESDYQQDVRRGYDNVSEGQFMLGWKEGIKKKRHYTPETLERLTWQNLGYRAAKTIPPTPLFGEYEIYWTFVRIFRSQHEENEQV